MKVKQVLQLNNLIPPRVSLNQAKMQRIKDRKLAQLKREAENDKQETKIEAEQEPIEPDLPKEAKE